MRFGMSLRYLALGLGFSAASALMADIPYFWLDKPTGRTNRFDPASSLYVAPTPIYPTNTATPFLFPSATRTPSASATPSFSPSPVFSATPTASPSASRTGTPASSATTTPTPNGSFTNSPTVSATPSATGTSTPSSCGAVYNFESGTQGWAAQTSGELAVTSVASSSVQAYCGLSLALGVDLRQSPTSNQGGQAYLTGAGFPMDLSCKELTAWIWVPAGMSNATNPSGAFLYAFTGAGWTWTPGTWVNLPSTAGWTQLTLNLNGAANANVVQQIGVKVALGGSSPDWTGTVYLDEVDIVTLPCATATDTVTVGPTATPTASPSPTPLCPLLPYPGLTRDWYTGTGTEWDRSPNGYGQPWNAANITDSSTGSHTPGNHLVVNLAWTGYAGSEGYNWAGWYEPNASPPYQRKVDVTQYDSLEFWIAGAAGGESNIAVRLMDGAVSPTASTIVNVNNILGGPLTTSWQKVVIPLCRFDFTGVDQTQIWEIDFIVDGPTSASGSMSFFIDDGQFVKYQAAVATSTATPTVAPTSTATPTPGCNVPSGTPVNEVAWWTSMPPVAQVWASAGTSFTQDTANPHTPGNTHMVWTIDMTAWWAAGGLNFTNWSPPEVDTTQFDTFEFWIRGAAGGEPLTISIGFTGNDGATNGTPMVSLAPYMSPLTTTYQLVRVPLCAFDFVTNGNDPTKVWQVNLAFAAGANSIYTVYVDDGFFRKY